MAGDWLKVEAATPDKPEVLQMAYDLNLDPDAVFGKVFRVWRWFDSHSEEGNAPSVTELLLDRQVGVSGFVSAMVSCGWMEKTDQGLTIPNFENHNGQSAKKRANTARRVAKHKAANASSDEKVTPPALPDELPKALAREEKRREDKTNTNNKNISDEKVSDIEPKKPKRTTKPKQTALPKDFELTYELIAAATKYWQSKGRSDLDPVDAFERFKTYHASKGSMMADWSAAWRTWYSNAVNFNKPHITPPTNPRNDNDFISKHTDRSWGDNLQ